MQPRLALAWLGLFLLIGCSRAPSEDRTPATAGTKTADVWFVDVSESRGLAFTHDPGPLGQYFMPEMVGSGAALFDYDNDGRLDIYLIQNGGPDSASINRLFHQEKDGHFRDVTEGSGLGIKGRGMGVAVGDIDNDGWPDVLVTEFGQVRLFHNNRNGTFSDVTQAAGIDNPFWTTSASFVDFDRDGWLDLVLVNYVKYDAHKMCSGPDGRQDYCGPSSFQHAVTKLYRNGGRVAPSASESGLPRFEDVTVRAGLTRAPGPGLGVYCADFDGDGWPDLLIANDGKPNHLWMNQRNGTFKEEAMLRGIGCNSIGRSEANMGIAVGDIDGDGLFDVLVTHLSEETHTLWSQGPRGYFQDRTVKSQVTQSRWRGTGFGTVLADFNHDGALDLAIANGHVRLNASRPIDPQGLEALGPHWGRYADHNQLFANDGRGHLKDVSADLGGDLCRRPTVARGMAVGDLDGDGALDLLVTAVGEPARLFRNVAPSRGHWLIVRAIDPALGGRDAYGAEVSVEAGGRKWFRIIQPASSYLCSSDPRAHFGLGAADRIDGLIVCWPDGSRERFAARDTDQVVLLRKGEGTTIQGPADRTVTSKR